ncbi:MAG: HEPN domain-containing protein [Candidatus Humimicrobiaceae bacterium]
MAARKIKVKKEDKSKSPRYLKKAEDNYNQMIEALNNNNYNAAATLAIQVALSAADAVCIHEKNIRSISENHSDLCDLIKSLPLVEAKNKSLVLKRIISKKNLVQYESRSMYKKEANQIVKGATRFYQWVNSLIG